MIDARAIAERCHDLLTTASAKHRHWDRVARWIEERTGLALSREEIKALAVLAQDFNTAATVDASQALGGEVVGTQTKVSVDVQDDCAQVTSTGIRTVGELMAAAQLDPGEWFAESVRPNYWESLRKDGSINPHFQIRATFSRLPHWATADLKVEPLPKIKRSEPSTRAMFIPDTQHGFRRKEDGQMVPMHDTRACALALEAAKVFQPHVIYFLGDHLDLAPWSMKFSRGRDVVYTTNDTLQAVHSWLAEFRRALPGADIYLLEGNHELRINRYVVDRMQEAEGLRAALGDRPVLSIPNLLSLDAIGVEYLAPYGVEHVLWDQVGVSHGTKHGARVGSLLAKRLPLSGYSWVQGHDHKLAIGTRAIHDRGKVRHITGLCPGTLSRVDGTVPGVSMHPNWSQGLGFASLVDGKAHLWAAPILNGSVIVNGQVLTARS